MALFNRIILALDSDKLIFKDFFNLDKLEGLASYGGQTSSSCEGLGAFGHQMGALQPPWTNTSTYIVKLQIQIHI